MAISEENTPDTSAEQTPGIAVVVAANSMSAHSEKIMESLCTDAITDPTENQMTDPAVDTLTDLISSPAEINVVDPLVKLVEEPLEDSIVVDVADCTTNDPAPFENVGTDSATELAASLPMDPTANSAPNSTADSVEGGSAVDLAESAVIEMETEIAPPKASIPMVVDAHVDGQEESLPFKEVTNTEPLEVPNKEPLEVPSKEPLEVPNKEPLEVPNKEPLEVPNKEPLEVPNKEPLEVPNKEPVEVPNEEPLEVPNKEPLAGEDMAARAAANALGTLDLGRVRSALTVGGSEAARGAVAVLSLAASDAHVHIVAPSPAAEAAARLRLDSEGLLGNGAAPVSIVNVAAIRAGNYGSFDLILVVAGLRDSPAAATTISAVASALRPGGRIIVALAAGPRPHAVAKAATEAAATHGVCADIAAALIEAANVDPPPCSDPAACSALLEAAGLNVISSSRHIPLAFQKGPGCFTASDLAEHLAAAWAGEMPGSELPEAEQILFTDIGRCCADEVESCAEEILEAEARCPFNSRKDVRRRGGMNVKHM